MRPVNPSRLEVPGRLDQLVLVLLSVCSRSGEQSRSSREVTEPFASTPDHLLRARAAAATVVVMQDKTL